MVVAYALVDEMTQLLVGRGFEWSDFGADVTGAALGVLVGSCISRSFGAGDQIASVASRDSELGARETGSGERGAGGTMGQ